MINKFKKNLIRQICKKSVVVFVILAFVISSFTPQVVDAKFWDFSKWFSDSQITTSVSLVSFPEVLDIEPRGVAWMTMTAYSSEVVQTDNTPCIPADWTYNLCDHYEKEGAQDTIAVNFLPLGTKVRFPKLYGDKIFTVRDRMNAKYGWGRGDFWMPKRKLAKNFGVQRVQMEIYYR